MNKGILCDTCNQGFSPLDAVLSQQLNFINGLIGVRPDRAASPAPARVEHNGQSLTIDHGGKPAIAAPRIIAEGPGTDGRQLVTVEFGSEKQVQEWIEKNRQAGRTVKKVQRSTGRRFVETIPVEWSFGGDNTFRELARVAMNFLAHRWPYTARDPALHLFKNFVVGKDVLSDGDPRVVWYAGADAFPLPKPVFPFGHQILIVQCAGSGETYSRVRLFATFDVWVWFGRVENPAPGAVLFDINPLADRAPNDIAESELQVDGFPNAIDRPTSYDRSEDDLLRENFRQLLARITSRQTEVHVERLLADVNATSALTYRERIARMTDVLTPEVGHILFLGRFVAKQFRDAARDDLTRLVADQLDAMLTTDESSPDGLTDLARASVTLATRSLSEAIAKELEQGVLTAERLRLFLAGGLGAHAVATALCRPMLDALRGLASS
jgi:hypothetical protein